MKYGIQGHSYNILAHTVHVCIRLSSHCNFSHLKLTPKACCFRTERTL